MDLGLHGIWVLLIWTPLVLKLSKFLVLVICQIFPKRMIFNATRVLGLHLRDRRVQV
jgi:hypothetical protein